MKKENTEFKSNLFLAFLKIETFDIVKIATATLQIQPK